MMNEEQRITLYQDYITTGLKILAESYVKCHGGELQMPSFMEMTHKTVRKQSSEEVIEHVKNLFA